MNYFKSLGVLAVIGFALLSCKQEKPDPQWSDLPTVAKLDSLKETNFVPTLENTVAVDKNSIYAPTLLYAWDEVRTKIGSGMTISADNSEDLRLLNSSGSFSNSLNADEYTIDTEIELYKITIRTFFNKTLPFPAKMDKLDQPVEFKGTKVAAFGMKYLNAEIIAFSEILYYRSDDEFALRFTSEDKANEIVLVKGFNNIKNLAEAMTISNELIASGNKERPDSALAWKYEFNGEDLFSIPLLKFNIDTRYKTLEGQTVQTSKAMYKITKAYQRTGFILNETGAVVESEAEVEMVMASAPEEETIRIRPHPKKMIFDKPFFIIVKKKDKSNPYFVMKVENTELMEKK